MKFMVDVCLSPAVVERLKEVGVHAVHWSSVGRVGEKDLVIMEWRASHDHTLITADTDFAHLLALMRTRAPSVLILRTADHAPSTVVPLILQVIVQWEA
jgi:predicted nuclease of predicted toxin-antitoxin system